MTYQERYRNRWEKFRAGYVLTEYDAIIAKDTAALVDMIDDEFSDEDMTDNEAFMMALDVLQARALDMAEELERLKGATA